MQQISNEQLVLDISVNLARVSDWILDPQEIKQKRVDQFLQQTESYLNDLSKNDISDHFKPTLDRFRAEFENLLMTRDSGNTYDWAERALTWANILQHRAKLA